MFGTRGSLMVLWLDQFWALLSSSCSCQSDNEYMGNMQKRINRRTVTVL